MEYEIKTEVFGNGIMSQEIFEKEIDVSKKVIKSILNTQEEGIRKALIDLGWTPPGKETGRLSYPFCEACKEKHCDVSFDGDCAMIRSYLGAIK